jgi:TPP-dependent 2-oxoacid decarboxylase
MIREVKTDKDGNLIGFVTYGTNTDTNDEALVKPEYVLGVYSGKLPGVGRFFAFVKSTPGYILCILVPFLILILYNGINVIRFFRRYKREQMAAMQEEKTKLEAERAENQRMMQELLALKAQLEQNSGEVKSSAQPASEATSTEQSTLAEDADAEISEQETDEN